MSIEKNIVWGIADITEDEIAAVNKSISSGIVGGGGPNVEKYETELSAKLGVKHAIAVNNGTTALLVSLFALKEYLGKEKIKVAVPSFTFIASVNSSKIAGSVKLIDCSLDTWNIESQNIVDVIDDIDIIMPVDVGGLPVDYDSLKLLGKPIIADSAESAGAKYKDEYVGSQADIHCFSTHRAKIFTTGEGGFITTNNDDLNYLIRSWGNHGYAKEREKWEYRHERVSLNARITDIEASIGRVQLRKLDYYVDKRKKNALIYREALSGLVEFQHEPEYASHPYFFFGIKVKSDINKICQIASEKGVSLKTWAPAHFQKHYNSEVYSNLKNSTELGNQVILLPIHNKIEENQIKYVSKILRQILKNNK